MKKKLLRIVELCNLVIFTKNKQHNGYQKNIILVYSKVFS